MSLLLVFPSDYFDETTVDNGLKAEYEAATSVNGFELVIFSCDQWFNNGKLKLTHFPDIPTKAIYRGWMMKPEAYESFFNELLKNNIELVTKPSEYSFFHVFPNVYKALSHDTAKMLTFSDGEKIDINAIRKQFERFVVKDYVKSVKGTDFPALFDSSITQTELDECMKLFYKYRGGLYTGGICIKEYLDLKRYGDKKNEYRVYYGNGEILSVSRNSGQGTYTPLPPQSLLDKYSHLGGCFYTIDYAELSNDEWKIIEAGDGQVSGLSDTQDNAVFFRALYQCFGS